MEDSFKNINVTIGYPSLLQATGQLMDDNKQFEGVLPKKGEG